MDQRNLTVRFRVRKGFKGHLFQGRFKAKLVAEPEYFDQLGFYLHLNPVLAGLVKTPEEYEWSSYRDYISAKPRFEWIDRDALLSQFGRSGFARIRNYRKACLSHLGEQPEFWNKLIDPVVIGSAEAVDRLIKKYAPKGNQKPVTDYQYLLSAALNPDHEVEKVADIFEVDVSKLKERRWAMPAKLAAYAHLVENCGMRPGQAAKYFGVSSSAVSKGVSRFKQMISDNPALGKKYGKLGD